MARGWVVPLRSAAWAIVACIALTSREIAADSGCDDRGQTAVIAMAKGTVLVDGRDATVGQRICSGSEITTAGGSRAVLQLQGNNATLRIAEHTRMYLREVRERSLIEIVSGVIDAFLRKPGQLSVDTPIVNAAIKGTEYLVRVGPDGTSEVAVFEGLVAVSARVSPPSGSKPVTGQNAIGPGYKLRAQPGDDLARVPLSVAVQRDELAWTVYYPPVVSESKNAAVREAAAHLSAGSIGQAARVLEDDTLDDNADALAIRSIIQVVRNEKKEALATASRAVAAAPDASSARIALSYAYQSYSRLDDALSVLDACRTSTACAPRDMVFQARLTELYLATGQLKKALAQCTGEPQQGLAVACGFAELAVGHAGAARALFAKAAVEYPDDPLAHLGLGLSLFRAGRMLDGRREIEVAAALDPLQSLVRSYLGKAYFEAQICPQDRASLDCPLFDRTHIDISLQQLSLAQTLDPNDPTPDLYAAIIEHASGRPVEALRGLESSQRKNGNRAVFRSRLLLDQDSAVRSTSMARVYRALGFDKLALVAGRNAVTFDPADAAAHRLLADAYADQPRMQLARMSELLQAGLRQPLSAVPHSAQAAELNSPMLDKTTPSLMSFGEYGSAFTRDGASFIANAFYGSNGTRSEDIAAAALGERAAISLGRFGYSTDGTRGNDDLDRSIYHVALRAKIRADTMLLGEYTNVADQRGDLRLLADSRAYRPYQRHDDRTNQYRVGFHYEHSPAIDFVGHYTARFDRFRAVDTQLPDADPIAVQFAPVINIAPNEHSQTIEIQSLWRGLRWIQVQTGIGYTNIDSVRNIRLQPVPGAPAFPLSVTRPTTYHGDGYIYAHLLPLSTLDLVAGASVAKFSGELKSTTPINPKLGATWRMKEGTTLRAAAFRTFNRTLLDGQSIEPVQIAGFSQLYEDPGATQAWHYGAGVDHRWNERLYGGLEGSLRELSFPVALIGNRISVLGQDANEIMARGYLYGILDSNWSWRVDFEHEDIEMDLVLSAPGDFQALETERLKIAAAYHGPSGVGASLVPMFIRQRAELPQSCPNAKCAFRADTESFILLDAFVSYRLPRRYGMISLAAKNLLDRDIQYQDIDQRQPRLALGRYLIVGFNLFLD